MPETALSNAGTASPSFMEQMRAEAMAQLPEVFGGFYASGASAFLAIHRVEQEMWVREIQESQDA